MEGLTEYHQPVLVEGILIICWFRVLQGFCGGRLEWGIENVGRVKAYIFLLHVFNKAFQLKAFLEDIMSVMTSNYYLIVACTCVQYWASYQ